MNKKEKDVNEMAKDLIGNADDAVVTFQCGGKAPHNYSVTVKSGWFRQEVKPDTTKTIQQIVIDHNILPFLHNPVGPAIENIHTGYRCYFINGRPLTEEEGKKLQYNVDFGNSVEEILEIK